MKDQRIVIQREELEADVVDDCVLAKFSILGAEGSLYVHCDGGAVLVITELDNNNRPYKRVVTFSGEYGAAPLSEVVDHMLSEPWEKA